MSEEQDLRSSDLREVSVAVRFFAAVALSVGSLLLALFQILFFEEASAFFAANQIAIGTRLVVLSWGVLGAVAAAGAGLFLLYRRGLFSSKQRAPAAEWAESAIRLVAPLLVAAFVPVLFVRETWQGRDIAFFCYAFAVGLALERLLRVATSELAPLVQRWPRKATLDSVLEHRAVRWLPLVMTLSLCLAYALRVGHLANVSHMKLETMSSDLAEYDNMFFNAYSGHPFRSPAIAGHLENWSSLQGHAEFGLYMLLPFYALSPGAHALLWIQAAVVGFTALPLFLLGAERLGRWAGLGFALAYFLMPAVQQPNFYDFHFTPLGMFFIAWLLFFVARLASDPSNQTSRRLMYVALACSLLCREDVSIGVVVLGTFLVLSGKLVRDGIHLAVVSLIYFVAMKFWIMPLFGTWWFDNMYDDLKAEGAKGFGAVGLTLLTNPSFVVQKLLIEPKFLYVLHMVVPMLALWLRRPLLWMAILPGFVATLLATNRAPLYDASFQYTYLWIPYVVGASILAVRRGAAGRGTLVAMVVVAAALANQYGVFPVGERIKGGFAMKAFEMSDSQEARYEALREIRAMIPPTASVGATEVEGPHLSNRPVMYSLKYTLGPFPDYLLVSRPRHRREPDHVRKALESGKYGVIAQQGPFILAKRGADASKNDPLWARVGGKPGAKKRPSRRPRRRKSSPPKPQP